MCHRILLTLALLSAVTSGAAGAATPPPRAPAERMDGSMSGKDLQDVLRELSLPSGIRFRVAPEVAHDRIQGRAQGTAWPEVIHDLLQGYNYVGTWNAAGRLTEVLVTGRNGNGSAPPSAAAPDSATEDLFSYQGQPAPALPIQYRSYAPGSVLPISVPTERLRRMAKGTRVAVNLPNGRYELVHDNVWQHANGDLTWVGYLEVPQGRYRAFLTLGDQMLAGQILTPGGLYKLESDGPRNWLIDIAASGLQQAAFAEDERTPTGANTLAARPQKADAKKVKHGDSKWKARATLNEEGKATIDIMLLYSRGLPPRRATTLLNNLMALANQAFVDSHVQAVLRLVDIRRVLYPAGGNNSITLDHLSYGQNGLESIPNLRQAKGADVIIMVRPFRPYSQGGSCGIAWVNGSGGANLQPDQAFGIVSHGTRGGFYCSDYALAHELGHILGASHDRKHTTVQGKFSYSYGYGIEGRFGDIMSYFDPEVGLFANPNLNECDGLPCGIPADSPLGADVVRTFEYTAPIVSGFTTPPGAGRAKHGR